MQQPNPQNANTVLTVKPTAFGFNPETATDNEFMHLARHNDSIVAKAMAEYNQVVGGLTKAGITVIEYHPGPQHNNKPDAVFPNNWFSTLASGTTLQYLMRAPNRQAENEFYPQIAQLLTQAGFSIKAKVQLQPEGFKGMYLEGTGSLVFDHLRRVAYMAVSERSHVLPATYVCNLMGYRLIYFEALSHRGVPFYHTNVMLSVGTQYAIVCLSAIKTRNQRQKLVYRLEKHHEIIDISHQQAENFFCGNVLQLQTPKGAVMAMSGSAWQGFTVKQQQQVKSHGHPLVFNIPTIEYVGGGSVRCMLAEVFLPKSNSLFYPPSP